MKPPNIVRGTGVNHLASVDFDGGILLRQHRRAAEEAAEEVAEKVAEWPAQEIAEGVAEKVPKRTAERVAEKVAEQHGQKDGAQHDQRAATSSCKELLRHFLADRLWIHRRVTRVSIQPRLCMVRCILRAAQ